jgi:hypothetical protein
VARAAWWGGSWKLLVSYGSSTSAQVIRETSGAVRLKHSRTSYQGNFRGRTTQELPHKSSRELPGPYDSSTTAQVIKGTSGAVRLKHSRTRYQGNFRGRTTQALPHKLLRELPGPYDPSTTAQFIRETSVEIRTQNSPHEVSRNFRPHYDTKLSCTSYEGNFWCVSDPRHMGKKTRIEELCPGSDKQIRTVILRQPDTTTISRPVQLVIPL